MAEPIIHGISIPVHRDPAGLNWEWIRRQAAFCFCSATGPLVWPRAVQQIALARQAGLQVGLLFKFDYHASVKDQIEAFRGLADASGYGLGDVAPMVVFALQSVPDSERERLRRAALGVVDALLQNYGECLVSIDRESWETLGAEQWLLEFPVTFGYDSSEEKQDWAPRGKVWSLDRHLPDSHELDAREPPGIHDLEQFRARRPLPLVTRAQPQKPAEPASPAPIDTDDPALVVEPALFLGDSSAATKWPMTPELLEVLAWAALLESADGSDPLVRFRALVLGAFRAPGVWSEWLRETARAVAPGTLVANLGPPLNDTNRPDSQLLQERLSSLRRGKAPLRLTSSSTQLLRTARNYSAGLPLGVEHLVAALIFDPAGHEAELAEMGFDRAAWAKLLVQDSASGNSALWQQWRDLREQMFTVSDDSAARSAGESEKLDWTRLSGDFRTTLLWATAAAEQETPSAVAGFRHFLAALMVLNWNDGDLGGEHVLAAAFEEREGDPKDTKQRFLHRLRVDLTGDNLPKRKAAPRLDSALSTAIHACLASKAEDLLEGADLFLALMRPSVGGRAALDSVLEEAGIDGDRLLDAVMISSRAHQAEEELRALGALLRARRGLSRWDRPNFDLDHVSGAIAGDRDKLQVRKPAERFAKLLAARGIEPPIALGLFGRWGSGKSTFMGLIKGKVEELQGKPGYVQRAVAIDFNAWHYQDTNLWASIALRIYEALAEALAETAAPKDKQPKPTVEAIRCKLKSQVKSNEARKEQAEGERTRALSVRAENVTKLAAEQARRSERMRQHSLLPLAKAWQRLQRERAGSTSDPELQALAQAAKTVEQKLGIPAALNSVEDLERLERETRATLERARGLGVALERQFVGPGAGLRGVLTIAGLGLLVVAVGWGAITLKGWAAKQGMVWAQRLPDYSAAVAQLTALLTVAVGWCSRRVHEADKLVGLVKNVRDRVEAERIKISASLSEDVAKAEQLVRESDQELQRLEGEIQQANTVIQETTAEIDRIARGGLIYDFVRERSSSERYTSQVGLVSTLREDLRQLGGLLTTFTDSGPLIERVVLYIDDLDRCQPEQVVDVLQAVHLLLAFPLFHVVVGVDPRWLSRSLRRRYVHDNADPEAFDPHEYLEKIFQIPYTLPEMTETGFKQLVGSLIKTRSEVRRKQALPSGTNDAQGSAKVLAASPSHAAAVPAIPAHSASRSPSADESAGAASVPERSSSPVTVSAALVAPLGISGSDDSNDSSDSSAAALFLEDFEERFLVKLHAFMDRPRLTKRFLNLYRLIRLRAAEVESEFESFAGSAAADGYRAAGLLLAINVGHPRMGQRLLQALIDHRPANGASGANGDKKPATTWAQFLEKPVSGAVRSSSERARDEQDLATIRRKSVDLLRELPQAIAAYKPWAEAVIGYSFQWEQRELEAAEGVAEPHLALESATVASAKPS